MYEQKTKKHTKIVATISDRKCDVPFIRDLYERGMNVVRLNTAHQSVEDSKKVIENVRKVSEKIAILVDTKGPEIRTTEAKEEVTLTKGATVHIGQDTQAPSTEKCIHVNYDHFVDEIQIGNKILIDDGVVELVIVERKDKEFVCTVLNTGSFKGKKTIVVPGAKLSLPSLTEKDKAYIRFAAEEKLAFIAHSFVRNKDDIHEVQAILDEYDSEVRIIAKIENQEGVDNIDEILDSSFGIMVARGDLGVEIPGHKVPSIQKTLVRKAISHQKVVIIATQMLHSMIENPRPTRAEINDVANAVYDRADAIMLSGESAYGEHPLAAVQIMTDICEEVEGELETRKLHLPSTSATDVPNYLSLISVHAARSLNLTAIVTDTTFGTTPRKIAVYRGPKPIFSFCYNHQTVRQLALCRSIYAEYMEPVKGTDEFVRKALLRLTEHDLVTDADKVAVIAGNFAPQHGASFIEISTVKNLRRDLK